MSPRILIEYIIFSPSLDLVPLTSLGVSLHLLYLLLFFFSHSFHLSESVFWDISPNSIKIGCILICVLLSVSVISGDLPFSYVPHDPCCCFWYQIDTPFNFLVGHNVTNCLIYCDDLIQLSLKAAFMSLDAFEQEIWFVTRVLFFHVFYSGICLVHGSEAFLVFLEPSCPCTVEFTCIYCFDACSLVCDIQFSAWS